MVDFNRARSLARQEELAPTLPPWASFAPWLPRAKGDTGTNPPAMTFLLPEDIENRDLQLLRSITSKVGLPIMRCNWVSSWDQAVAGGTQWVVSFGKGGVEAWHQWGMVQVNMHGTVFRRDHWHVMVCEHPGGGFQRTAWGYGVKEHLKDEIHLFNQARLRVLDVDDFLGEKCVKCLKARVKKGEMPRVRPVHAYYHEADWVGLCEDHWKKRAEIVKVPKKRVNPSSREGQMKGQGEMFG